jgi:hypothetical protein
VVSDHGTAQVSPPHADTRRALLPALLAYTAASLFHHAHNATFLAAYPNLPAWLSPAGVYAAWAAVTSVGVAGYLLLRGRQAVAALALLGLYAALGLTGLDHYTRAPPQAHSAVMNLSILGEVATAAVLLGVVAAHLIAQLRRPAAAHQR